MSTSKLHHIQSLRAFAALLVVLYHYPGGLYIGRSGYVGVDLFFVISGYIMVRTTYDSDGSVEYIREFALKRFFRVWPPYAVVTIVVLLVSMPFKQVLTLHTAKWTFESLTFYPLWQTMPIVKSGWTLSFEMYFYAIFALSMMARSWRWVILAAIFIATLIVIPNGHYSWFVSDLHPYTGISAIALLVKCQIIWCFTIGIMVAHISIRIPKAPLAVSGLILIPSLSILGYMYFQMKLDHGLVWAIPIGLCILSLDWLNNAGKLSIPRFATQLGNISYSIYLVHESAVDFFSKYATPYFTSVATIGWLTLPYLSLTLLLAIPSYFVLERHLSRALLARTIENKTLDDGIAQQATSSNERGQRQQPNTSD